MKARFQIFKTPFFFVGWLAPAYGDRRSQFQGESPWDERSQSQRDHIQTKGLQRKLVFSCSPFGFIMKSFEYASLPVEEAEEGVVTGGVAFGLLLLG